LVNGIEKVGRLGLVMRGLVIQQSYMVFWPVQGRNPALSIILYFSILLGLLANWQEEEVENVEDCFVSNERSLKMINESNFYMIGMILT
jgi:hypothetical protein